MTYVQQKRHAMSHLCSHITARPCDAMQFSAGAMVTMLLSTF